MFSFCGLLPTGDLVANIGLLAFWNLLYKLLFAEVFSNWFSDCHLAVLKVFVLGFKLRLMHFASDA